MQTSVVCFLVLCLASGCAEGARSSAEGVGGSSGTGAGGTGGTGGTNRDTTAAECVGAERLVLTLTRNGRSTYNTGPLEFEATITSITENSAVLETCPGEGGGDGSGSGGAGGQETGGGGAAAGDGNASHCDTDALRLEIEAPGLALPVVVGTNVAVTWNMTGGGGTGVRSMVVLRDRSDDAIEGFLLGIENGLSFPDPPLSYTKSELRCAFDPPAYCSSRLAYALTFTVTDNPSSSARLTMGQEASLELDPSGEATWRVHAMRAIVSGACDALDPIVYYVVREP